MKVKSTSVAASVSILMLFVATGCVSYVTTPLVPKSSQVAGSQKFYFSGMVPTRLAERINQDCSELMAPGKSKIPVELLIVENEQRGGYTVSNLLLDLALLGSFVPVDYEQILQAEIVVRNTTGTALRTSVRSSSTSRLVGLFTYKIFADKDAAERANKRAWENLARKVVEAFNQHAEEWIAFAGSEGLDGLDGSGPTVLADAKTGPETSAVPGVGLALLVGINDYQLMGKLNNCRQDASAMRTALVSRGGYSSGRTVLMADGVNGDENKPSFANLSRRIEQTCKLANPEDVLLIYFAGHGITEGGKSYLVPQDGGEARTCIQLAWIQDQMQASAARSKVLIVDACHSGKNTRGISGIVPSLSADSSCVMISSCAENELSYPDGEHGAFTKCLLDGILGAADANANGQISNKELFGYIKTRMDDWCIRTGKTQRPQMLPQNAKDIDIIRNAK